jgi:EAL domain-containing protein (putative c-di-GMP-specific phosphodiesterase class I)
MWQIGTRRTRESRGRRGIDQCCIAGLPGDAYHRAVVRAVVAIGQALKPSVVAEDVESEAQAETLLRLGCHDAQGYHFDRPLTGEDFQPRWRLPRPGPEAIVVEDRLCQNP